MRHHQIHVLNAHGSKDSWCSASVARFLGIMIIRSRHIATPISDDYIGQLIYGPLSDVIMTTGEGIKREMVEKGIPADKIISVPTGTDMSIFPSASPGTLRQYLNIPASVSLVGQVAALREDRGRTVSFKPPVLLLIVEPMPGLFWLEMVLSGKILKSR